MSTTKEQSVKRLFELINLDDLAAVEAQWAAFEEEVANLNDSEDDDETEVIWIIKDVIDWESGFFVDWKDTESFIASIDALVERVDISIDWGVEDTDDDDFLDSISVPDLMEAAYEQLRSQGYTLWNWATEGDCYGGWLAKSADDEEMLSLSEALGVEFRTGDMPF
ncbi:DUF6630 family protein [Iodobacter fluviatilis]|jgi:hypothetical protein|uniref:DUF6630 domain-containing protein n=1 Tax=Iodobacter fluviatilis TaxID=537 RepID=A0A7G3G9S0_9NEIS|nr:hypothetical protein [Iodobacter fluviatilis]QBC43822.1 hypothetical protein C1H71_09860 [Iodobacter fluviatilis]